MNPNTRNNLILQGFGGPKLVTQGFGPNLAYRTAFYYDRKGNVTCVLDPDNGQTYYTYDKMSRMTSVKNPWGETAYYEYSPGGKLLARTLGNGCVTYYAYDRRGVTKVENLKSDLSVISTFEYQRDRTGNPLSILREDGSCVYYEYDLNQQLTAETQTDDTGAVVYAWEWDYDRAGNRLWQTFNGTATYYEYNAGNELVTETTGGQTTYYDYDRNGNQTAKQAVDGTTYFHYDFENLLRQIDLPDGAHNYFTYDADSKRVSAQDSTGYTRFIYQGPDMLKLMQERNAAGETQAQYTMGMGLESMRRGEASSFFHYDALGSTQELTDAAEAVTDTYRYNAWGEILARAGSTENPHAFAGGFGYYLVPDPTLYLLGLRYYFPGGGRLLSRDPAHSGVNDYCYAEGNAAALVDPTGLYCQGPYPLGSGFANTDVWIGPDGWCLVSLFKTGRWFTVYHYLDYWHLFEWLCSSGGACPRSWTEYYYTHKHTLTSVDKECIPYEDPHWPKPAPPPRPKPRPRPRGCQAYEKNKSTDACQGCCEELYYVCLAEHQPAEYSNCRTASIACETGCLNSPGLDPHHYYPEQEE